MAKHFVIAVGGTGMRCLESLVHLCAAGMFDDQELHVLLLDTDINNGNKDLTQQLLDDYVAIKGGEAGAPTRNSFFTANIKKYTFAPEYKKGQATYDVLRKGSLGDDKDRRQNKALAELFFDDSVLNFDLSHGYRAQTHLGSLLMYHAFVESARRTKLGEGSEDDKKLELFIKAIHQAGPNVGVFVLGSIFGGTGASSIPVLPRALKEASLILLEKDFPQDVRFGCTLLTEYFGFPTPSAQQQNADRIVADSNKFALNSQAALTYYDADITVKNTYKARYHIGWPLSALQHGNQEGKVVTGGPAQQNKSHVIELMCAAAAWHFLMGSDSPSKEILARRLNVEADKPIVLAEDLVGEGDAAKRLKQRMGMLYSLALFINRKPAKKGEGNAGSLFNLKSGSEAGVQVRPHQAVSAADCKPFDRYLQRLGFSFSGEEPTLGWIFEVREQASQLLGLQADAFQLAKLNKFDLGEMFGGKRWGGMLAEDTAKVIKELKEGSQRPEDQNADRPPERFIGHIFQVFSKLYGFDTI